MIQSRNDLKNYIKEEKKLYAGKHSILLIRESDILHRHLVLLRKTEYYCNTNRYIRSLIFRCMLFRFQNRYSLHVPINTCGVGLNIAHVGPVIINQEARIGKNCKIHVGVNIGMHNGGTPHIGDNVYIGPGAKIFGDIIIADDVKIGANAVVNKNFRHSGVVVGIPANYVNH